MSQPTDHDTARSVARHGAPSPERSEMMTRCHIIIIGAGIGGLTAALSLQRHGFSVSV